MTGQKLSRNARRVFADYLLRVQDGEAVDFEKICADHPSICQELQTLQSDWVAADCRMAQPSVQQDFTVRLKGIYGDSVDAGVTLRPRETEGGPPTGFERLLRLTARAPSGSRYVFLGEIARGGMGIVIHVWDTVLRRNLAMKVVPKQKEKSEGGSGGESANTLNRFLEEAQVAAQLDHPGVVPIHDLGIDSNGQVYFTMPLIEGRDLQAIFAMVREGKEEWTLARAVGVILRVCDVMAYAHSRDVIHRDLKPANVMVGKFGEAYVMDWGLAKVIGREDRAEVRKRLIPNSPEREDESEGEAPEDRAARASKGAGEAESAAKKPATEQPVMTDQRSGDTSTSPLLTMAGTVIGTPAYMPPEQAQGRLDEITRQSDVYSLGAILYHLLTGQMPYVKKGARVAPRTILKMVINGPPPPVHVLEPAAPPELAAICEKAMARDLEHRYAAMADMQSDLRDWLEGRVVTAYDTGTIAQFKKLVLRNKALSIAIAASVLIAAGALLTVTYVHMRVNQSLALANEEITKARDVATAKRTEAERKSYVAEVIAAQSSLKLDDVLEAKRRLAECPAELRGWEWFHLQHVADSSLSVLRQGDGKPQSPLASLAVSPDGARAYAGSIGGKILVWDIASREPRPALEGHTDVVNAVAASLDGELLASASSDGTARVWDLARGALVASLAGHEGPVCAVAFSADGARLATGSEDGTVRIWDAKTWTTVLRLTGHAGKVFTAQFSLDGLHVASGSEDKTVRIHDARSGAIVRILAGHESEVRAVAFSPGGGQIASGSRDETVRLWDVRSGNLQNVLSGHKGPVHCLAYSLDGSRLASGSADLTCRLWDAKTGHHLSTQRGHDDAVWSVAFFADGCRLASASWDRTVRLWDAQDVEATTVLEGHRSTVAATSFSAGGERVVSGSHDRTVMTWNTWTGEPLAVMRGHEDYVSAVAFLAGGRIVSGSLDGTLRIWGRDGAGAATVIDGQGGRVLCVAADPQGTRIASGGEDGIVRLWHTAAPTPTPVRELAGHAGPVLAIAFSPDGSTVASASADKTLALWSVSSGERLRTLAGHEGPVRALALSADGQKLLSGSEDRTIRLWDTMTGGELAVIGGHRGWVTAVGFSPDGQRFLSGSADRTLCLWDTASRERLLVLRGPVEWVHSASFSPDGMRILTSSKDAAFRILESEPPAGRFDARAAAASLRNGVRPVVDALFSKCRDAEEVVQRLRSDQSLGADEREVAVRMASLRGDDHVGLVAESWQVVLARDVDPEAVARAVARARKAVTADPTDARFLAALGAALYRAGELAEAREQLVRAEAAAAATDSREQLAGVLAFLAMTLQRSGLPDEAAAALGRLRGHAELVQGLPGQVTEVVREAEEIVSASRPAPPGPVPTSRPAATVPATRKN